MKPEFCVYFVPVIGKNWNWAEPKFPISVSTVDLEPMSVLHSREGTNTGLLTLF